MLGVLPSPDLERQGIGAYPVNGRDNAMNSIFAGLALIGFLAALNNWRTGLIISVVFGFLQDPLRKFLPDHPITMQVLSATVFMGVLLSIYIRRLQPPLSVLTNREQRLDITLRLFIVLTLFQALHSLMRYNSLPLTILGLANYLLPLAAIMAGFLLVQESALEAIPYRIYGVGNSQRFNHLMPRILPNEQWPVLQKKSETFAGQANAVSITWGTVP